MGPTPIALGPYQFQALGFGMTDLNRDLQTPWAEIDVAMRFDALHWTGPKSDSVTIKGVLFPQEFGGLAALNGIAAAARAGRPLTLVTGAGDVGGRFVVVSVSEDWSYIDARGRPRRDAYQIQLRRYAGASGLGGILGALTRLF
jgi:phage protein U